MSAITRLPSLLHTPRCLSHIAKHYTLHQRYTLLSAYHHAQRHQSTAATNPHHPFAPTARMLDTKYAQPNQYSNLYNAFQWQIPEHYNIGYDICDKHVVNGRGDNTAVTYEHTNHTITHLTFHQLSQQSNKLANVMIDICGVQQGDRIGILASQCIDTVIAHAATYKINAVAVPLFVLFGSDALQYRLNDSGCVVLFCEPSKLAEVTQLKQSGQLPRLQHIIIVDSDATATAAPPQSASTYHLHNLQTLLSTASPEFACVHSKAEDPAVIIYTSGTTGSPKGALHAHRILLGHLPGVEFPHNFFPQPDDRFWTPADWAWIGGMFDCLLTSLHHGVTVVAHRFKKFDAHAAFALIERHNIRNMFMPPTALKLMRTLDVEVVKQKYKTNVRSIACGGEPLGEALLDWAKHAFNGVVINEFYGQTECNLVIGNCSVCCDVVPGSMGRAVPGHIVHVVTDDGVEAKDGTVGNIAIRQPDPVAFLKYLNLPEKTADKYRNGYLLTGDMGKRIDGYFYFFGRNDDVIKSGGYRIGPNEIEECLMKNKFVSNCAVVGEPDATRGEIVKAFVILNQSAVQQYKQQHSSTSDADVETHVRDDISQWVKTRLAAYEYPRKIVFMETLPMTTTGKIIRSELKKLK